MRVARTLGRLADPFLRRADLAVVRRSRVDRLEAKLDKVYANRAAPPPPASLPPGAEDVLRPDHPLLADYEKRYAGHPAAISSQWSQDYIRNSIDMRLFRSNNSYVWQQWDSADPFRFGLATYYTRLHDRFGTRI